MDARISFEGIPHTYYVDGKVYNISVTEFVRKFFKGFNSQKIIRERYDTWQNMKDSKYNGISPEEILEYWETIRKEAARLGRHLHKKIKLFYNGHEIENDAKEIGHFFEVSTGSQLFESS